MFPAKLTFSRVTSLQMIWKFIKPRCKGGCRSTFAGNSALLSSNVIDFAILPARRLWRETVSLLDVMWPQSNRWERALLGNNFQLYKGLVRKQRDGHNSHEKWAVKRGRVMQICVRDHLEVHPQKEKRSSLFCKKNLGEIGESSDQLSELESDS